MVYFKQNLLKFPKHFDEKPTKMELINETTGEKTVIDIDDVGGVIHYYVFDFSNVELENGIYTYTFGAECGLLQVGDFNTKQKVVYER